MVTQKKPPLFLRVLLLCAAFLFPFLCVEVYFRLNYPSSVLPGVRQLDDGIGWDGKVPVVALKNTGARQKVFFLGDSNVDGKQWMQFTQENAAARGVAFDGYSLGVSGHGTTQQLLKLQRHFDEYKPNVVVLLFTSWNDLRDNVRTPGVYYSPALLSRPYYVQSGSGYTLWNRPASWLARFLSQSEVYVRIPQRLWLRFVGLFARHHMSFITENQLPLRMYYDDAFAWQPFYDPEDAENPYVTLAYDTTAYNLKLLKEYVESKGSRLIALSMDNAFTVDPDVRDAHIPESSGLDPTLPLKRSAEMFRDLGIPYTDTLTALRAKQKELNAKIFDGGPANIGGHLLPEGEHALADAATPAIINALQTR